MSFSRNLTQQADLMNTLEQRLTTLTADRRQFTLTQEQEPTQAQWEAAWTLAGNTGGIPLEKPLVWLWKGTIRGEYIKPRNNYYGYMHSGVTATGASPNTTERFYFKGWYDNTTMVCYGEILNPVTYTVQTGTYQVWLDGSYRLITSAALLGWLPNQKKGVFLSGTNIQLYDEVLNTFTTLFNIGATLSSPARSEQRVAVNPTNPAQFAVVVQPKVGFWNGTTGISWTPANPPASSAQRVWIANNQIYFNSGATFIRSTFTGAAETVTSLERTSIISPEDPAKIWRYNLNRGYAVTESAIDLSNPVVRTTQKHFARTAQLYATKDRTIQPVDSDFENRVVKGSLSLNGVIYPSPDNRILGSNYFGLTMGFMSTTDAAPIGRIIRTTAYSEPDPDYLVAAQYTLDTAAASFTVDFASQLANLDSKYEMFQLRFQNTPTNNGILTLAFNNDTAPANYDTAHTMVVTAAWGNTVSSAVGGIAVQTGTANLGSQVFLWLFNVRNPAAYTTVLYTGANTTATPRPLFGAGAWKSLVTPTQFSFTVTVGTFAVGTLVELIAYKTKPRYIDPNLGAS